jgi:hypothetical protein
MPLYVPRLYMMVHVADNDAASAINSVVYIPFQRFATVLDFDRFPATHFRVHVFGNSNEAGQTVTLQVDQEGDVDGGGEQLSAAGNDLVITNTTQLHSSAWIAITRAMSGIEYIYLILKGSNATVDLSARTINIEWRIGA